MGAPLFFSTIMTWFFRMIETALPPNYCFSNSMAPGPPRPEPGTFGGYAPPCPAVHFWTPKSEPKNRQNLRFWIPFSYAVSILFGTCLFRITFCHLICGLVVVDAPPAGLSKGYMFLLVLEETICVRRTKTFTQVKRHETTAARGGGRRAGLRVRGKQTDARRHISSKGTGQPRR